MMSNVNKICCVFGVGVIWTAISSLDHVTWHGKSLKVSLSKHASVQLPRDNLPVSAGRSDIGQENIMLFYDMNIIKWWVL